MGYDGTVTRLESTPTTERLAAVLTAALDAELPAAVALRNRLHADPEPSGAEVRTTARVTEAIGTGETTEVAGTGRLIRIGPPGPSVAVRAELDALPVPLGGASTGGFMHACGHDVHMAAVAALARAAATVELPVALLVILQPREEAPPSGAHDILRAKVLDGHDVRAAVAAHVQPLLPRGTVAATPGAVNAAANQFEIVITGRGGHGGYPHLTRDPVLALAHVVVAVQQVVSRRVDPLHAAVLTIGSVHAGSAANVIPDEARAQGTMRVLDESDREPLQRDLTTIVEQVAAAYGCRGEVHIEQGEPALVNDPELTARSHHWLGHLGLDLSPSLRSCGADDFAYYRSVAPSLMLFVGVEQAFGNPDPARLHHPSFHPSDDAVGDVARALLAGYLAAADRVDHPAG
jgi:amidohydrolase